MADLIGLLHSREQEESRTRRINGVVVAIVTNNKDDQQLGRVKLKFPWLSNDNETDWSRICTFMAGSQRGSYFLPEVGDEVLVAFENGDFNRPYVIGSIWSNEDKPPPPGNPDGKNNIKKIHSRSGHEIIFDDSEGGEKVQLFCHKKDGAPCHTVLLDDTAGSENILIKDKTGTNIIKIDSVNNSVSISTGGTFSVTAQSIEINAISNISISAGAVTAINGTTMVKIN